MATVAEALIIKLGLDAKDVKKGSDEVQASLKKTETQANKTGKELEQTGKKSKEFFTALEAGVVSLIAAVGAAKVVKSFFDDAITGMAALGRSSEYAKMSAAALQGWEGALESVGGSAADAKNTIIGFNQSLTDFIKTGGHSEFAAVLNHMGLDLRQFASQKDPTSAAFLAVADKFKGMSANDALYFGSKLGFSQDFVNLLRQGSATVGQIVAEFKKASGATDENTKAAQRAQAAWTLIKARFAGLRDELEGRLTPVVQRLLEQFADWLDKNKELISSKLIEWVEAFATWLKSIDWKAVGDGLTALVKGAVNVVSKIEEGVDALGGWKNILIGMGALWTLNMLNPLTQIVAGIGAARAGLVGLAAVAGWGIGSYINSKLDNTKAGDVIGGSIAKIMALFGDKDAQQALESNLYSQGSPEDQAKLKAGYLSMSAKDKAKYEKDHPGLSSQIKSGLASQRVAGLAGDQAYYAQHSATFGDTEKLFAALSEKSGIPAAILSSMFTQESGRGKNLVSKAGAKGPFQFMDATAKEFGLQGNDAFDLDKSATAATLLLRNLLTQFHGNMSLALTAYNSGSGNVTKYGGPIPGNAESMNYASDILARAQTMQRGGGVDNSRSAEVSIGTIQVNAPQATDASGIANALPGALRRNSLVAQATTGIL